MIIEFLDEAGQPLDAEIFTVEADPSETVIRDVPYGPGGKSIDIVANTSSLRVSAINLGDGTSVSSTDDPKIILRSGAQFVFRLK